MSSTETTRELTPRRHMRADALRNYDKLIAAAREAFAEGGAATSLEAIARRAGVGIGTLYRHFPTRQALLEAVYVGEVEGLCRSAAECAELEPWEALAGWLRRFAGYVATKYALAEELFAYIDRDSELFRSCRVACFEAGEPLLERAQRARAVRDDVDFGEVIQMIGGIAKIPTTDPGQIDRILD